MSHGAMLNQGFRCHHCGGNVVWSHWAERLECLLCCRPTTGELAEALTERLRRPKRRRVAATVSGEEDEDEVSSAA